MSKLIPYKTFLVVVLALPVLCHAAMNVDTTDKRIIYYRASLAKHKEVVQFIDYTLKSYGLPVMLRNLALIESDFDNSTLSTANAAGTWQITPDVASDYGLRIDSVNDERYDLYKSTQVACRNLADLYKIYKDWIHVVAAYNCGAGRVNKAIQKAGTNDYAVFYKYLPDETILHVYKFQMACYASGNGNAYTTQTVATTPADSTETALLPNVAITDISAGYDLAVIARRLQIPYATIADLNPAFKKNSTQRGQVQLHLPTDKMPDFLLLKNEILKESLETEQHDEL